MMDPTHAIAIMTARERTADLARQALPDAPTVREPDGGGATTWASVAPLRQRASRLLRHMADRIEPRHTGRAPLPGGSR